MKIYTANTILQ